MEISDALKRKFINEIDLEAYLEANPDIQKAFQIQDILEHLIEFGIYEIYESKRKIYPNLALYNEQIYLDKYKDVQDAVEEGIFSSGFEHFLRYGHKELLEGRRIDKMPDLDEKELYIYNFIKESTLFDEAYYLDNNADVKNANVDPILHYIQSGYREGRNPSPVFDTKWYLEQYLDIAESGLNPFYHYIIAGKKEGRCSNEAEYSAPTGETGVPETISNKLDEQEFLVYQELSECDIDWSNYFIENTYDTEYNDPIVDYIKNWCTHQPIIPKYFDTSFYLIAYPDIKQSGLIPLLHYVKYGNQEGRQGILNKENIVKGHLAYDPSKETIVFVTHESSASGAPLLGLNIADKLKQKYNIVHIVIKKSNIHDSFLENCDLMLHDIEEHTYMKTYINSYFFMRNMLKERPVKCVIINSIVAHNVAPAAKKLNLPILFLIHEFSEYMRPSGTMAKVVLDSDNVIVPAQIIKESIYKEFEKFTNHDPNKATNIHIIPQGKLPYLPETYGKSDSIHKLYEKLDITSSDETKIIVASGWVQIRKGVDLFVSTARYIKQLYGNNCKFVWVGGGFNPDEDLSYSVYLEREIEFSGLGNDFIFLEHQQNLDNIFSIADVFCLTSRMDPFPNVVIDALNHDLHIACFNHASGSAEFLANHDADSTIVDFVDTYAMAKGIVQYLESGTKRPGINKQLVDRYLNFDKYVEFLDNIIDHSEELDKNIQELG